MINKNIKYHFHSYNEKDTEDIAGIFAGWSNPGMVIALDGELGAGKTRFSQAFAKFMGISDVVNSPTFTLIKEYNGTRYPLFHMDVYRISMEEAEGLGLDEYFYGEGVTIVEWASRIKEILPPERLDIQIEHAGERERRFEIIPSGQAYIEKCEILRKNGVIS
jgi:tRNA threonylcarbamoyladenosine biosynthesis protein TsaE